MISGIVLYSFAIILSFISFSKDRVRTKEAFKKGYMIFYKLLPEIFAIMLFIGLSLAVVTPEVISSVIGEQSGFFGVGMATIVGSLALIPSFVVFPLGGTLLESGAGYPQLAAFVAALMSVGIASLPMERKMFGRAFAYSRNIGALVFVVLFSIVIWAVM